MTDSSAERMVQCHKLGESLPGLAKPPFKGELGARIFEGISAKAWSMWQEMQIKVINEYRLNMGDKKDYEFLVDQMERFLNLKSGEVTQVGDEKRGRGR